MARKKRTAIETLRLYRGVSDLIINLGFFSIIFSSKLSVSEYFGFSDFSLEKLFLASFWANIAPFVLDKWPDLLFFGCVFLWFWVFRKSVKNEIEILNSLFSRESGEPDWGIASGKFRVAILSVGIIACFFLLTWFIDDVQNFCLIALFLNIQDAIGNSLLRKNMLKYFSNSSFDPDPDLDQRAKFIMQRRHVALQYWVFRPQVERIGLMMVCFTTILILSRPDNPFGLDIPDDLLRLILGIVILTNEITMQVWRRDRNAKLNIIDEREEAYSTARRNEIRDRSTPAKPEA